ncbi:MAG: M23 family metallopeptidase [Acidobacteriota bacterium]|nr:M23 family metallopeptidase [Acidobacteriota bacterium]
MRIGFMATAVFALASAASAAEPGRPTAIVVSPIHEAQVVRGDDGMDHVEYELLVVSVFPEPVTLTSVTVLDAAGKKLMRIEGGALTAATQPLFAHTESAVIPASAAVSVEVDLILAPNTAPERVTHQIAYSLKADSELAPMITSLEADAPEVAINRRPTIVIKPPVRGEGWLVSSGCCKPNIHRDLRIAIDGARIETAETFAIDWNRVKNDKIYDGDGKKVEQHYAFGEEVFAVADGTVVSIQDGKPETTPNILMKPETKDDYGGNHVILEIAPNVFALYLHLHPGSIAVKVGDVVKAGAPLAKIGNSGPSMGPHLHFSISDKPDFFAGRSLPFVFDSFTSIGTIDFDASKADRLVILPDSRQVRSAYPLYGSIQNYP